MQDKNKKYHDHTNFLNELRRDILTGNFRNMSELRLDCFHFEFPETLSTEEQIKLGDFMGTSDNLNSLSPVDFCIFFLENNIKFILTYQYSENRTSDDNFYCALLVQAINERLGKWKGKK